METTRQIGYDGESAALAEYVKGGFALLERNWYLGKTGEIDLILYDPLRKLIIFCEVKRRKNNDFCEPSESVNFVKQNRIRKVATGYLSQNPCYYEYDVRFDVAEVYPDKVNIIEDAF